MILIADSGSTKTDWCVVHQGTVVQQITTQGMNPFFQSEEEMAQAIAETLCPQLPDTCWEGIYFYGAGCIPEKRETIQQAIASRLHTHGIIEVHSDMQGAARALCGHEAGIACIIGTGSNSCFYDGSNITANVSPLGFILGDEGSGACLGKLFIGDLLKNQLPSTLKDEFLQHYQLTAPEIIELVYRKPFPNRFLASLSPFIAEHLHEPALYQLVLKSFKSFIQRNVQQYDYAHYPVHFTGSIAWHYQTILKEAASQTGIQPGTVLKSPLSGLVRYHSDN